MTMYSSGVDVSTACTDVDNEPPADNRIENIVLVAIGILDILCIPIMLCITQCLDKDFTEDHQQYW